jgi:hypothetical protein
MPAITFMFLRWDHGGGITRRAVSGTANVASQAMPAEMTVSGYSVKRYTGSLYPRRVSCGTVRNDSTRFEHTGWTTTHDQLFICILLIFVPDQRKMTCAARHRGDFLHRPPSALVSRDTHR